MWNSGNTMTNKQYHIPAPGGLSAQTFPKSNIKIVERDKIENIRPLTLLTWYKHSIKKWRGKASFKGPNLPSFI
jgi:hypothetical protein